LIFSFISHVLLGVGQNFRLGKRGKVIQRQNFQMAPCVNQEFLARAFSPGPSRNFPWESICKFLRPGAYQSLCFSSRFCDPNQPRGPGEKWSTKEDVAMAEQGFFKRRPRPAKDMIFDYKDVELISQFTTPGGKIVAARVSRLNAKQQRQLARAVKRARQLALLPNGAY
jgi:small subunit ribosomal protein S18